MVTFRPDFRVENDKLSIKFFIVKTKVGDCYFPPSKLLNYFVYLPFRDNFVKSEVNYLSFEIEIVPICARF